MSQWVEVWAPCVHCNEQNPVMGNPQSLETFECVCCKTVNNISIGISYTVSCGCDECIRERSKSNDVWPEPKPCIICGKESWKKSSMCMLSKVSDAVEAGIHVVVPLGFVFACRGRCEAEAKEEGYGR